MKHKGFVIVAFLTVVMWTWFALARVEAAGPLQNPPQQTQPRKCDELQIVFVVDQSGSMSRTLDGKPGSDPEGLRFFGPKDAVDLATALRYQSYVTSTIRIALVHFGDRPRTVLPWTSLDATNEQEYEKIKKALEPSFARVPSQGNTNPLGAFQTASSLFNQVTPQVGGCPARVVIAITDGQPSLPVPDFSWQDHLNELATYVNTYMAPPEYKLYVIGLDRNNAFWRNNRSYWERIVGDPSHAALAADQFDMAKQIRKIVKDSITESLTPNGANPQFECITGNQIQVPPFVQQAKLTLIKPVEGLHLEVLDETGRPLEPTRADIKVQLEGFDAPIESLTISKPRPGFWTLLTKLPVEDKDACDVTLLSFDAIGKLNQPSSNTPVLQFKRLPVSLQIVDSSGDLLPEYNDPQSALDMDLSIVGPNQNTTPIALDAGQSYEFHGEIIPLDAGSNTIHVKATTHNPDGSERVVFDKPLGSFQVTSVKFGLLKGPSGIVAQYRDLPVKFAITSGGQPAQIDLTPTIEATITTNGKTTPLELKIGQDGSYDATFHPTEQGKHVLAYKATVQTPRGPVTLGEDQIPFDVFPTTLVGARFENPTGDRFVATDWKLTPTGLPLEVQIVDDKGKPVGPGEIGAANPQALFNVKVLDANKKDVTGDLKLLQTGKPGLYRLSDNTLAIGQYEIIVMPSVELGQGYLWAEDSWSKTISGDINPLFFGAAGSAILAAILLALLAIIEVRSRQHPLSGEIEIYRVQMNEQDGTSYDVSVYRDNLPNRNRAILTPDGGIVGFLNRILPVPIGKGGEMGVRRIIVTCESESDSKANRARAEISTVSEGKKSATLSPESSPYRVSTGYFLIKGPRPNRVDLGGTAQVSEFENPNYQR